MMYSYLEALSLEGTSDSIEQLSHYLEICDLLLFFYFIYVRHLGLAKFSS